MHLPTGAPLDASKLSVTLSTSDAQLPPSSSLVFGQTFSSHMLTVPWSLASGWGVPEIKPYGPLMLDPSATVLHYAQELFEGMKAYKDKQGRSRLFRPDLNMQRMRNGANRMAFPDFDPEELIKLIQELVKVDDRWIPTDPGCSLYIRPTMIGTRASLGVGPSTEVLLFVICSPVAKYYSSGAKPISLLCSSRSVRAWPGGTGDCKFGSNYGPCVAPQIEAAQQGYQQVLWVFGEDDEWTEVGMMNAFVVLRLPDGALELATPSLATGLSLPGVTRDSILGLARQHAAGQIQLPNVDPQTKLVVSERKITMSEIVRAQAEGNLVEVFGSGTAAVITSVEKIGYRGQEIKIPVDGGDEGESGFGRFAGSMVKVLNEIQYGERESEWSWLC
ncbi:uncharacterized protein JCM15063_006058 [Sporobolomyces koalae]|uniref:uncharacterized protein n=1 Tax=Sporobolomyces koalae TaxID=500713 RepID=UPI00317A9B6E